MLNAVDDIDDEELPMRFFWSFLYYIYIYVTVKYGRSEINTTKEMSENVVQPGIEPGSPDYRSDALTTRPLNQPRWQRGYFKAL